MGLDMFCFKVSKVSADAAGDIPEPDDSLDIVDRDFAYWRKFNALHGWMERLYNEKGGTERFNCQFVRLELGDIDRLESDAKAKRLEPTVGFFFGPQDPFSDDDRDEVLEFCTKARAALNEGFALYYDSWW